MVHTRHVRSRRRVFPGLTLGRALLGREMAHGAVIHLRLRLGLGAMRRMILRGQWGGQQQGPGEHRSADHASPPLGKGRTVTTCIMPACMW